MKKIFTFLSVVAITATAFTQELLTNPGFETGLSPWAAGPTNTYTAPAIITTDAHSGAQSAGYVTVSATTGFYQNVAVTAGETYVISFWYKGTGNGTDSRARLWSLYKDTNGGTVYTTSKAEEDPFRSNNGYLPEATTWTKYTAEMIAGPNATNLEVAFRVYAGATNFMVDDFSVMNKKDLAVSDISAFDKQIKMNTDLGNALTVFLPSKATVNIYTAEGRLVSSTRVNSGDAINTSSLKKGMYIVTVDNGTAKVSRKAVKN
ncbi:T9SS C-terminal target domain-containing protein [Kaistella daneshvariae]|uniref:T9SS C-terminal target domain-containing protein n=1 Tax=Kaistella daneshvariae TaxID=2487074 RepID=A0ABM7C9J2_9FLAO|nr:T9SS type A sorting domain-containing protein [Kaistella daneshvariae]AZI67668.1 T9SS C-terminal target domain-containing protein [Kaistella daneshvariae]